MSFFPLFDRSTPLKSLTLGHIAEKITPCAEIVTFLSSSGIQLINIAASHSIRIPISDDAHRIQWTREAAVLLKHYGIKSHRNGVEVDWEIRGYAAGWGEKLTPPPSPPAILGSSIALPPPPLSLAPCASSSLSVSVSAAASSSPVSASAAASPSATIPADTYPAVGDVHAVFRQLRTDLLYTWQNPTQQTYGAAFPLLFNLFMKRRLLALPTSVIRRPFVLP